MKKSALIKLLAAIEGDPEIKIWNGLVDDWMDVDNKLVPVELTRKTKWYYLAVCLLERRDVNPLYEFSVDETRELENRYKTTCRWEINPYVGQMDIVEKRYTVKTAFILQAKVKGLTSVSHCNSLAY